MFFHAAWRLAQNKVCRLMMACAALMVVAVAQAGEVASAPASNAVTQAAVQQGVFACAGRINQVSSFLGYTAQAGALLLPPPSSPDQRLIPLVMEVATANGPAYVSATFAPNQANGCGAAYDAVVYWPQNCEQVASTQYSGLKKTGALKKDITVFSAGSGSMVFLMRAGSGCVSIKKEVVL